MATRMQPRNSPSGPKANAAWKGADSKSAILFGDLPNASWLAGAFGVGALLIWSLLVPADSISVFIGEALPQNLGWMLVAVACSLSAVNGGFLYSRYCLGICGAMLVWLIAVSWHAGFENDARTAWYGFWQVIALAACYFCTATVGPGPRSRGTLVGLCLVGCIALANQGLYQVNVDFPEQKARYQQEPEQVLLEAGIDGPPGSAMRQRFEDRLLNSSEPFATFALANSLATLLSAGLVLIVSMLVGAALPSKEAKAWASWIILAAVLLLILVSWFLTRSRTAYAAVCIAGLYWLTVKTLSERRLVQLARVWLISISIGGLLLAGGIVWLVRNDELVLSEAQKSLGYRLEYWQATIALIREHWLFGVGLGNFQSYYPQYKLELASEIVADPHNWFLDIAATLSLPIAIVILVWLFSMFWPRESLKFTTFDSAEQADPDTSSRPESARGGLEQADRLTAKAIVSGAIIGGLIGGGSLWLLGSLQTSTLLCWAVAAGIGYALWPLIVAWSPRERLAIRSAALAMLSCLLASGSWQASGIGVPFLVLLVASQPRWTRTLVAVPDHHNDLPARSRFRNLHPVFLAVVGLACFVVQAWRPATSSWASLLEAESVVDIERSIELAEQAARQDPLDSKPLGWLAARKVDWAVNSPSTIFEIRAKEAIAAVDDWLASDRVNSTTRQRAGDLSFMLYATARQLRLPADAYIDKSVACYDWASRQYPSSVQLRVQLAAAMAFAQDWKGVELELGEAQRISEQTPHLDKKIENQTIWLPSPLAPELTPITNSGSVPAEPLVNWLRNLVGEKGEKGSGLKKGSGVKNRNGPPGAAHF